MKVFTATQVRQNFQEIIDSVYYTEKPIIVVRRNKPRVVVSPLPKDDKKVEQAIRQFEDISKKDNA